MAPDSRGGTRRRRRAAAAAAVVTVLAALGVSGCGARTADEIDYAIDGTLPTYNANTVVGAASGAPQAFARTLTGFSYHGPDGQVVADTDFGTVSVVGRAPLLLDYEIKPEAVYSDGKPITCDDLVLAWAAQSGRFPGFDAASRGGYSDIAGVECVPGQKKARVAFVQDRNVVDWGRLFTATALMPAHVIADELGVDVVAAVRDNDLPTLERIAAAWNTIWDLHPDIDLRKFPSSGPYKLAEVTDEGAVVLVANDKWWGTPARTRRITVWPRSAQTGDRLAERGYDVVDIAEGSAGTLNVPDDYTATDMPSAGIQQLIFAPAGPLAEIPARRALAHCTPRDELARTAGVPISNARLNPADDDAFGAAEGAAEGGQFAAANPDAARAALGGRPLTVRIGYAAPNPRLAAAVGAIAAACAPAGITVTDAATEQTGPASLRANEIDVLLAGTGGAAGGGSTGSSALDAYALHSGNGDNLADYRNERVDGIIGALAVTTDPKEVARLIAEGAPILWGDMPTLPLYRQQRTLVASSKMYAVTNNPTRWGAGWNMDRWVLHE